MNLFRFCGLALCCAGGMIACRSSYNQPRIEDIYRATDTVRHHAGLYIYDPQTRQAIAEHNADKAFVAASNMKYFTLYAACLLLQDSLRALAYEERGDSLIVRGMGDPSFLNANMYNNDRAYRFLSQDSAKSLCLSIHRSARIAPLGAGWSWDDYTSAYAAQRSDFPIYGNVAVFKYVNDAWRITPKYFKATQPAIGQYVDEDKIWRPFESNHFKEPLTAKKKFFKQRVPFYADWQTTVSLLQDTLHRAVTPVWEPLSLNARILKSIPVDSAYRVMLQESDNHVAEQLLLQCAIAATDTMQTEAAIRYAAKNFLKDLPNDWVWVDGSGLSRYNLCAPRTMVRLLMKIENVVTRPKLMSWLAVGGKSGTLKNNAKRDWSYVCAKSGSMRGVYNLAGYLKTKSGKTLIFSYMNNGFAAPQAVIKEQIERALHIAHASY